MINNKWTVSCRYCRMPIVFRTIRTLVQALISCLLDYCNSMFYGITDGLRSRLQSVQNAAARLVSGARRYDHITPVLYMSCTGLRSGVGWTLRWPLWSTCHCPVWLHLTWLPTVSWSPTKVVVSCVLPTQGHVSSEGPAAAMETDALLLQVLGCGTVCQFIWDKLTLTINSLNGSWRHFCLGVESAAHCGYC